MYRYRRNDGVTTDATEKLFKHVHKAGELIEVRGYQHRNRYGVLSHAIMFKGRLGSLRFNGFCYGYGGTGPRGLRDALVRLGVPQLTANAVSFNIHQRNTVGIDWRLLHDEDGWTVMTPAQEKAA